MLSIIPDMLADGWIGRILLMLLLACIAALIWLLGMFLYWAADSWFASKYDGIGVVVGKHFEPEHTELRFNAALKMSVPVTVDDEWTVTVKRDNAADDVSVTEDFYNSVRKGQHVRITYHLGRISGGLYVDQIGL